MILLTTKEFLEQAMYLDLEIRTKKDEIRKLEKLVERVSAGRKIKGEFTLEGLREVIGEYSDFLVKDITKLVYMKHIIITKINELEDSRDRVLLTLRYIDFMTWEEIANEMGYSTMQVHRLHKALLQTIDITK